MDDQENVVGARPSAAERPQESGAAALGRGGRMSRQRKTAAVLRFGGFFTGHLDANTAMEILVPALGAAFVRHGISTTLPPQQ